MPLLERFVINHQYQFYPVFSPTFWKI